MVANSQLMSSQNVHYSGERMKYHDHRNKARDEPHHHLTVIIDGMDQAKTNLPRPPVESKSTQNLWMIRTHITGELHY